MQFDFSTVGDVESFISVPEGTYPCRVAEVRSGIARDGSVRWSLRLEVADGEHAGRTAGWDGLTWSDRGIVRVKRVLEVFGYDVAGELEVHPEDLVGRRAVVEFRREIRDDALSGRRIERLVVPWAGYAPFEERDFLGEVLEAPTPNGGGGEVDRLEAVDGGGRERE